MEEKWHCENCGEQLHDGDEIIDEATGTFYEGGMELGDHFIMHAECLDQKLERFKEQRIKKLLEFEFENFKPQYICNCTGANDITKDLEEMWPKADIVDEFDEMRFILEYGVNMGEIGNIPKDWKAYRDCNTSDHQELRKRADKYLEKLMDEEGFE